MIKIAIKRKEAAEAKLPNLEIEARNIRTSAAKKIWDAYTIFTAHTLASKIKLTPQEQENAVQIILNS